MFLTTARFLVVLGRATAVILELRAERHALGPDGSGRAWTFRRGLRRPAKIITMP